jgi:hypothetical protein
VHIAVLLYFKICVKNLQMCTRAFMLVKS